MHLLHILEVMIKCSDVQDRTARSYQNMIQELVNHKCSPLLQRFPAQHMESRAHRFRLLRQGMQAPRASLQNSSAIQSSSSVHTPDCYSLKTKEACHTSIEIKKCQTYLGATSSMAHGATFTHGIYLQGIHGYFVSHSSGGRGARTRTDSVGAFAPRSTGQVLDGVGVHEDGPRVNVPEVS